MATPKDGIYYNIPFDEYRSWEALSKSSLSPITVSPAHAKMRLEQTESKKTPKMVFGSLVDSLLFDSEEQIEADWFIINDDIRRDKRTKTYKAILDEAGNREIVKQKEWLDAAATVEAIQRRVGPMLDRATFQVSIIWTDPETGIRLKGRPDIVDFDEGIIWDLKTTQDPRPGPFSRTAANLRYHWQAGMYTEGLTQLTDRDDWLWGWVSVEAEPPHSIYLYSAESRVVQIGWEQAHKAVKLWHQCEVSGEWPAHVQEKVEALPFPEWVLDPEHWQY